MTNESRLLCRTNFCGWAPQCRGLVFIDISRSAGLFFGLSCCLGGGTVIFGLVFPDLQSRRTESASTLSFRDARLMSFLDGLVLPKFDFLLTARAASLT